MKPAILALFAAFLVPFTGCAGPGFNRDWNKAATAHESGASKSPVAGPWTGTWASGKNRHNGKLRCLIAPVEGSKGLHRFHYRATWAIIFGGGFKAEFPLVPDGKGGYVFAGKHDLGKFGSFEHRGRIEGGKFSATYKSSFGDHGTFEMSRP